MDNMLNFHRVSSDQFDSLQVDQNFPLDEEFDSPAQHSLSIPRKKHKKSKNRHRHSDTIWTIVQEQELGNSPSGSKSKHKHSKSGSSKQTSESKHKTKDKNDKIGSKKNSTSTPTSSQRRASFLENPIFETELKNWTLPRAELWCRDPNCQINAKLFHDYCSSHQDKLTHTHLNELEQQQVLFRHPQHSSTVSNSCRHTCVSSSSNCFNDSIHSTTQHSMPMILCEKRATTGVAAFQSHSECRHPFHQPENPCFNKDYQNRCRKQSNGNMKMNMSIGAAMNDLNTQDGTTVSSAMTSGVGTYSSPSSNTNGSGNKNYNNTHHTSRSTPTVIITVPSGASCNTSINSGKTTSPKSVGHQQVTSSTGTHGESEVSTRDDFNGSSSSSSSRTDVSSGSTFVTGFDSSESRTSSVPSSLSKPPLANMRIDNNHTQHRNELHSYNNKIAIQKSDKMTYGDSTTATGGGCPTSLPFVSSSHRKSSICPSCNGIVPSTTTTNHHLVPVDPLLSGAGDGSLQNKSDNAFWNFTKFQHPLQRDHSFHSVGGFTLNGQYNAQVKKRRVVKFCSSHKIALVVSTFSLMVTVGLIITLILMKKRGMMDTMDMMPT